MGTNLIYVLLIVFWSPGQAPVPGQTQLFASAELCSAKGQELDRDWVAEHRRGNTSWACLTALRAEQENGV